MKKYRLSKGQLVISWTISQPGITIALCGARTPEQAIENAKAGHVTLETDDIQDINNLIQTSSIYWYERVPSCFPLPTFVCVNGSNNLP